MKQRAGESDAATYIVQIVNKPHQVVSLKVLHALPVLLPIKDVFEPTVKPG